MNNFELRWVGTDPQTRVLQFRVQTIHMSKETGKISATWSDWSPVPSVETESK